MYSNEEIGQIQEIISEKRKFSPDEISAINEHIKDKKIMFHQIPFLGLFITNKDLYEKVTKDAIAQNNGLFAFFPESYGMFYGSQVQPELEYCGETRGYGAIIKTPEKQIVIKPYQVGLPTTNIHTADEKRIALISGNEVIGPKQYKSLDGYLTEEYLDGPKFTHMPKGTSEEQIYNMGQQLGNALTTLHANNIYYNDTMLSDDLGKSHIIITPEGIRLIDFGAAIDLTNHPNYTDEQAFNYGRTIPLANWVLAFKNSPEELIEFASQYKALMRTLSKEEIFQRDEDFVKEGIMFSESRMNRNMSAFYEGFNKSYR